jgi:hypothetical protein
MAALGKVDVDGKIFWGCQPNDVGGKFFGKNLLQVEGHTAEAGVWVFVADYGYDFFVMSHSRNAPLAY